MKIIVIDDEECIRDSLKWYLEDLGHVVRTASNPASYDVYHGHRCSQPFEYGDALLIGCNMPGLNGLKFVDYLRTRGCKGIIWNILIMSGNATAIDMAKAAEFGCRVFQKPLRYEELDNWLEDVEKRMVQNNDCQCERAPF